MASAASVAALYREWRVRERRASQIQASSGSNDQLPAGRRRQCQKIQKSIGVRAVLLLEVQTELWLSRISRPGWLLSCLSARAMNSPSSVRTLTALGWHTPNIYLSSVGGGRWLGACDSANLWMDEAVICCLSGSQLRPVVSQIDIAAIATAPIRQ